MESKWQENIGIEAGRKTVQREYSQTKTMYIHKVMGGLETAKLTQVQTITQWIRGGSRAEHNAQETIKIKQKKLNMGTLGTETEAKPDHREHGEGSE